MAGHSRFAPSATARETSCHASFILSEHLPDRQTFDAAHGTAAHHVAQLCLKGDHDAVFFAGCRIAVSLKGDCRFIHEHAPLDEMEEFEFEVDDEMETAVQSYLNWCRILPGDHHVEIRVEHTRWCPDFDEWGEPLGPQYGTADHIACEPKVLYVTDLKYGKGVQVYATRNKQAAKYALGAWLEYDWMYGFEKVVIRIAQPRLDHYDEWEISIEELLQFGEEMKEELTHVFDQNPKFSPSEKNCKFCKASGRCKPQADFLDAARALHFEDETKSNFISTNLLSLDDLAEGWRLRKLYQVRFDAIVRELMDAMKGGVHVGGLKMVAANGRRYWKDPARAAQVLRELGVDEEKLHKVKFVSPNQAEDLLTKEFHNKLADLWDKPVGGPCIVLESDPRDEYKGLPVFEGFEDETFDDGFDD